MSITVSVPKDMSRIQNKVLFNLTKRQLLFFGVGIVIGVPSYFLIKKIIPSDYAIIIAIAIMFPFFIGGMYERDGFHIEDVLKHYIQHKFVRPQVRPYQTENIYYYISEIDILDKEIEELEKKKQGSTRSK